MRRDARRAIRRKLAIEISHHLFLLVRMSG
jgi:hypothetical protein